MNNTSLIKVDVNKINMTRIINITCYYNNNIIITNLTKKITSF